MSGDDIQRNKVPETGQMYMLDFLWIIIGVWWIVKNWSRENRVIVHWLLVAPVATALTFQSPHALRAQNMVIPLVVISATGFCVVIQRFSGFTSKFKLFGYLIVSLLITWQFGRYVHMYYKHMSVEYPYSSQYGLKELVEYVRASGNNYENIVVTTRYDQPYILFLFYLLYPPEKFQNDHSLTPRDNFGFSTVPAFDKFVFKPIEWDFDRTLYPNSLIIGTSEEIPAEGNIVKRIYGQNNFEYFEVVAN